MSGDQKTSLKKLIGPWFILGTVLVCIAAVVSGKSITRLIKEFPVQDAISEPTVVEQAKPSSESPDEVIDRDLCFSCDALEYIKIQGDPAPEENTSENGSYYCIYNYQFTNIHPETSVKISWKHMDSTLDTGPYWTHPDLMPGATYEMRLYKNKNVDDRWTWVDGNYLMAWFDTEECNMYMTNHRGTDEEPDKLLKSGLEMYVITNPCAPER